MFATGEIVGLAEWIIDDTCLVMIENPDLSFSDGRVFRMVTKYHFEYGLPREHKPEMLRAPLEKVVLDTKLLNMGPPKEILALAMDPPDPRNIHQ